MDLEKKKEELRRLKTSMEVEEGRSSHHLEEKNSKISEDSRHLKHLAKIRLGNLGTKKITHAEFLYSK